MTYPSPYLESHYGSLMRLVGREIRNPAAGSRMVTALSHSEDGSRAYHAGADAWRHGDLRLAATQFRIAAGYRVGDAAVRLAETLLLLDDTSGALAWCAVASNEGKFLGEVQSVLERCHARSNNLP